MDEKNLENEGNVSFLSINNTLTQRNLIRY